MIFVTGANGFLGCALVAVILDLGLRVKVLVRNSSSVCPDGAELIIGNLSHMAGKNWFEGVNTIVHTASRVHMMDDSASDPLEEYRQVNVEGTLSLARQAEVAGVKRFIFISSIKVNGEGTTFGSLYQADDPPDPVDPYGISKMEAEIGLQQIANETGMEVVIIRPPLVYGSGVKANFQIMMRWLNKGIPLPLGSIHNKRSLVALDNLVDLIVICIDHPAAANQIFLAGDGEDLSTTELLQRMAKAMGKPARLIPVPTKALEFGAMLLGKQDIAQRLCGSLQVDISKARELLGWVPPISVDEGLRRAAAGFKQNL